MPRDSEVGWIKRTPKSDKIERWRCQIEKDPSRKVYKGVKAGSGETGDGGRCVLGRGRSALVLADIDTGELGKSRKRNCYNNAPIESYWGTLKQELINHRRYRTGQDATQDIIEYIEIFYRRQRR